MKKNEELAARVTELLHARKSKALSANEITDALKLRAGEKKALQGSLHALVKSGQIVKIRDNQYAVGDAADLVTGTVSVLRSGHGVIAGETHTAFVHSKGLGTALPGDRVLVRLDASGKGDRPGMINGVVIRILERARHEIVGTLRMTGRFLCVVPVDPSYGRAIYVPDAGPGKVGDRVLCRFVSWEDENVNPEGIVLETLGSADDPSTDTLAIVKHYGLPEAFPEEVVREAESVSGLMERPGQREDCRGLVIFTIDPARARDFDDALSIEVGPGGAVELGVHIADVSHFVRPGSALDREAVLRGNSVYLPDQVIPMLPEQLSNGICSLRPNEDRLTFSVFMKLSEAGHVTQSRFAKTIIRSQARLTYEQAMEVIDGKPPAGIPAVVQERIIKLKNWAMLLRRNRFARYALDLDMPECEIEMGQGGRIQSIKIVRSDPSHQLVEEFMVAANEAVAKELSEHGTALISRWHAPPNPEKIEELAIQLIEMGHRPGDLNKPRNLSKFLDQVKDDPLIMHIRMAVLRSLMRAVYSAEETGHYGLAKTYYAHFTSPIRRYPDLIVHRQLEALLTKKHAYSKQELIPVAINCSQTEQTADEAERALSEIKKFRYLEQQIKDRKPQSYEAVVVSVMNFGIFVELVDLQLQGLVHISALSDSFVSHDRGAKALRAGKVTYRVGTKLKVRAAKVDFDKRQVDFVLG